MSRNQGHTGTYCSGRATMALMPASDKPGSALLSWAWSDTSKSRANQMQVMASLIQLARGADVLVQDALFPAGVDRLVARVPNASSLKKSIMSHHTTAEDAGRIAGEAGVKQLVLSHLVPPDDPQIAESDWIAAARQHFSGPIVVGKDLLEI